MNDPKVYSLLTSPEALEYIFLVLDDMFAVHLFSIAFPLGHF